MLGALITKLKATGLYDKSLIVLASDHGAAFAPSSPRRKITEADSGGIAGVPFFMKLPGERRPKVIDRHVETIDILPTIADALDFELPEKPDGKSALADGFRGQDTVRVWSTTSTQEFERVDIDFAEYRARFGAVLAQQASLFGVGASPRLWQIGPNRDLIGQPLEGVSYGPSLPAGVSYDNPEEAQSWDPAAPWSPSHVTGVIDGLPSGRDLALAVNGRIQAVGRSYAFAGKTRFSLMAPESAFRPGFNELSVLAVSGSPDGVRLQRLGS
jgi:arylsulfatase A-like enzyme